MKQCGIQYIGKKIEKKIPLFTIPLPLSKAYQLINIGVLTDNFGTFQGQLAIALAFSF
jgi:hypothetical protein